MRKKQGFFGLQEILCLGHERGAGMGCERKPIYENEPQSVAYTMTPLKRYFKGQILYTIKLKSSKKNIQGSFFTKKQVVWCEKIGLVRPQTVEISSFCCTIRVFRIRFARKNFIYFAIALLKTHFQSIKSAIFCQNFLNKSSMKLKGQF